MNWGWCWNQACEEMEVELGSGELGLERVWTRLKHETCNFETNSLNQCVIEFKSLVFSD